MITKGKVIYIQAAKNDYAHLGEELLDVHNQIDKISGIENNIDSIHKDILNIKDNSTNLNKSVIDEIVGAKGEYNTINDRLMAMNAYDVLNMLETMKTTRSYEYNDNEYITKEHIRGDLNYDVVYTYDEDNNIVREDRFALDGRLIGYKDYKHNSYGQITEISGENTDDIITATNTLITNELDTRLKRLEGIDFVQLSLILKNTDIEQLWNIIQEMVLRIQNLEMYLPDNQNELINLSSILDRISELENRASKEYILYKFDVKSDTQVYDIPTGISDKNSIYLEGLLLDYGTDYTIENNKILFNIQLIDDFTITCKY